MQPHELPGVLVVDDSPEKRLALESVLGDLPVRVVVVSSGRAALRRLLVEDFAVILLDVRMPEMDGFETAALIRSRPRSEHTPIIFVSAFGDETHVARGYSLKAVDYLMAPIVPDVLRTKVCVLVELYEMTARVQQQASAMQQRAAQLHRLTEASLAIHAAPSLERMARLVADAARDVVRAQAATVAIRVDDERTYRARSDAPGAAPDGDPGSAAAAGAPHAGPPEPDGTAQRLVVPLVGRDGADRGTVQVAGRVDRRPLDAGDRDVLVQLGHVVAIAVENALSAEAREANRLKDEFLATVSHELRTPLSAILSWAEILRRGGPHGAAAGRAVDAIERNARAQARLVDDLLDVSRIVTGKLRLDARPVDLGSVVRGAADAFVGTAAAKGITLVTHLDADGLCVRGDADRLLQVVNNLLGNAVKFTPAGGRVDVTLRRAEGHAVLGVRDSGVGISASFLPYVFDRFRQVDGSARRRAGGLGLGLAIVRNLVELHGGGVEARSAGEGQGATFVVRLPLARSERVPGSREEGAPVEPPDLAGVRVLVVEDEADIRDALRLTLSEAGAVVDGVATAAEAFDAIARAVPDVLVCDIGLPGEDGYLLIAKIRGSADPSVRALPAVALTAYARSDDRRAALEAGFQAHLAKPADPRVLQRTLAVHVAAARRGVPALALPLASSASGEGETRASGAATGADRSAREAHECDGDGGGSAAPPGPPMPAYLRGGA